MLRHHVYTISIHIQKEALLPGQGTMKRKVRASPALFANHDIQPPYLQVFAVDFGHALEFFDVLGHAGVFVVEVVAAGELVEAGLGVLALLDLQVPVVGHAGAGGDQAAQDHVLLETEAGRLPQSGLKKSQI